jgi:hypothetical protein
LGRNCKANGTGRKNHWNCYRETEGCNSMSNTNSIGNVTKTFITNAFQVLYKVCRLRMRGWHTTMLHHLLGASLITWCCKHAFESCNSTIR